MGLKPNPYNPLVISALTLLIGSIDPLKTRPWYDL